MVHENYLRACGVMTRLLDEVRISRSRFELLAEVERQLRALLRIRSR
jgi:rRNA pseudouridine-1189 N-methylase Emg1 (Nep1/Mra1 family)